MIGYRACWPTHDKKQQEETYEINKTVCSVVCSRLIGIGAGAVSFAKEELGPYQLLTTISIPGNLSGAFDISWVDSASERYYLSERTTVKGGGRIDVIDAEHDKFLYSIGGFTGNQGSRVNSGPTGVLVIHKENELWAGDGDSTVKVVDLSAGPSAFPFAISTGGTLRADELAYDPIDHIILIANDADTPPFVTFVSQEHRAVLGHISYPQAVFPNTPGGPAVNHGLEQPVWNQQTKKFYLSVPATMTNPNGEVDEIDPLAMKVTRVFPIMTPCGPAGLALLPGQRLITSCGVVLSVKTGGTLATISGVGGDEIWFNSGDERVYFGANPMGVVDSETYQVITILTVGPTHSVAANSENNHIFVPVTGVGVKVFSESEDQEGRSNK
jgi:hypothetical protein